MSVRGPRVGERVGLQAGGCWGHTVVQDVAGERLALLGPESGELRDALRPGREVEVTYHDRQAMYRSRYRVEGWQTGPVPLVWLSGPREAVRVQRRQHVRLDVDLPVTVELAEGPVAGRTLDLSAGGLAAAFRAELPVGDRCPVVLSLPDGEVRGTAVVLRRLARPEGSPPAYALQFVSLGEREREAIYRFLFHEMRLRQQKGLLRPQGE